VKIEEKFNKDKQKFYQQIADQAEEESNPGPVIVTSGLVGSTIAGGLLATSEVVLTTGEIILGVGAGLSGGLVVGSIGYGLYKLFKS